MILIASILGGTAIGFLAAADRRGTRLFVIIWLAVFAGQTALLLSASDDVRNRDTGGWELAYFPISLAILGLGFALLYSSAALRRHVRRPGDQDSVGASVPQTSPESHDG